MKKKILAVLISVLSIAVSFTFGGCFKSCDMSVTPTRESVSEIVFGKFNITLPENITLLNYSTEMGLDGGIWYCVFDYDGYDENFNAILSEMKDEEFEKLFIEKYNHAKNYFNEEYEIPDLTKKYQWFFMSDLSDTKSRIYHLLILYFQEDNQLIIIDDTLQNYDL